MMSEALARKPLSGTRATGSAAFSPLYRQIKDLLVQALDRGDWKPGDAIPSETELALSFQVSQGTVRKAVDELAAENLLIRRQGKGTFVSTHHEARVRFRFLRLAPNQGEAQPAESQILDCKRVRASIEIARALELKPGDPVVAIRRLLSFASVPTVVDDIYLPGVLFKGLTADLLSGYVGPLYGFLETEFGISMVRADERLKAVLPDEQQAQWLQVSATTPLLSVERVAFTYNDLPMELRRGLYRTDLHHYRNQLF
jgi:GntR family transcriptional regulator